MFAPPSPLSLSLSRAPCQSILTTPPAPPPRSFFPSPPLAAPSYNGTIVAYGQTGSGKTHTVFGSGGDHDDDDDDDDADGLVQRSLGALFRSIAASKAEGGGGDGGGASDRGAIQSTTAKVTFFEIFNERAFDLLADGSSEVEDSLAVREDAARNVYIEGLTEVTVSDAAGAEELLVRGTRNRQVASTSMNKRSSRSHAVFCLSLRSVLADGDGNSTRVRTSKFTLVDLAGSERQRRTDADGDRLREASSINTSLLTLGNVVSALVDREAGRGRGGGGRHVPFRDSKLTFLLRDSWGGNSKTCLVATVDPSASSAAETVSTLRFAQRAKLIRNTAVLNEDACGTVAALQAEIARLRFQLLEQGRGPGAANPPPPSSSSGPHRGRPPLAASPSPSPSGTSAGGGGPAGAEAVTAAVFERRARRAEGRAAALDRQLDRKEDVVRALKRKLREEHMVQKFKQRRIDHLSNKEPSPAVEEENGGGEEVASLRAEVEALRRQLDLPSPALIEMKVKFDTVSEELERKDSASGPGSFHNIERESLENVISQLTDDKRALEVKLSDLNKNSTSTKHEIDSILEEVSRLETEMRNQKDQLKEREGEALKAQEGLAAAGLRSEELQTDLNQANKELAAARSDISALEASALELNERIDSLSKEVEEKKASVSAMELSHAKAQEELSAKVMELNQRLEDSNITSKDKAEAEVQVREELAVASKDVILAAAEMEKQKQISKNSEVRIEQLEREKDAAEASETTLREASFAFQAKIESLENEKNVLSQNLSDLKEAEATSSTEMETLKTSLAEIEERLQTTQQEKLDAIRAMQTSMEEQEESLSSRMRSVEAEKASLESMLSTLKSRFEMTSSATATAMESERASHQAMVEELQTCIKALEQEKEDALADAGKNHTELSEGLESKIKSLEAEKSVLNNEKEALERSVKEAALRDTSSQAEVKELKDTITKLEAKIHTLEGNIETIMEEKEQAMTISKQKMEDAQASHAKVVEAIEGEKGELIGNIVRLEKTLEGANKETEVFAEEMRNLHETNILEMQEKMRKLESEKDAALKDSLDQMDASKTELESKIRTLEEEKSQLKEDLSALRSALGEAEDKANSMSAKANEGIAEIQAFASDMSDQIKSLEKEKEETQLMQASKLKEMEDEKQIVSDKALSWEQAAEKAMKQVQTLRDQVNIIKRSEKSLKFEIENIGEDQDTLNEQVRCLHERNEELEQENDRLLKLLEKSPASSENSETVVGIADDANDDDELEDSFDEDLFLPNADVVKVDRSTPSKADTMDKENAGTPFRAKSTGKKRPLSSLKNKNTTPSHNNTKKRLCMTSVVKDKCADESKSMATPSRKYPKVMSETKHRSGWSSGLRMKQLN